ncbi:lysosomal membrane ascorbate-dependent ferrireductase CYB561A3 isoform X1 [Meriones unguiculatus]|uniref:lysosomal membrane ascorbate-dependent ferrireductase CYB561A3 isoform X1 n=1 Tax=Meriones unguiculatus TaxID=10047 RepID=UPI00293E8D24|nr:lysosomal membrane ascorbate-dependent ferrireductase CYB561A3 isoform X1 [Meriones unguiculatus]XP_060242523.1 lysosomal membrane ascorbate-dependent ferrireductase CYB561A3 isoform X1 [Meriones unguiculatus]XP_060242532.1 lysosomal membrane ascorbate-dependent ferrireductase CYB561A3 isoform X1 [Meriones unguiculatus]XP_060242541.1 lysosomal membrane ascorbate-dependent ferrireductase CYB561A3 isoform X1 [Meriones unguiculatus]
MASGRFYLSCMVLGSLGSMCILFTIYWMQYWRGGFAWDGSMHMFNWHPVLMISGMVVLYGAGSSYIAQPDFDQRSILLSQPSECVASLVYRLPSSWVGPKLPWKILHAALHLLVFTFTVVGLVAVFQFHNHSKITHLYSLHSWLGITTVILFACQWFLGFAVFLLPWASQWLRSLLKPVHVFFGACILSLSITSVISGINEKVFFVLKNATKPYSSLPSEAVFANSTGLLVVIFGVLVLYVLLASSWKRPDPGALTDRQPLLHDRE